MNAIITTTLSILSAIAPGATVDLIAKIIDNLTTLVPVLVKEYKDMVPIVKQVIAVLKDNDSVTDEQLADLDALEAKIDAEFDSAAAAALAEDQAAVQK